MQIANPPIGSSSEVEYLRSLKEGERVIELGKSCMTGSLGTVYINKDGVICVMWETEEGKMGTSVTHGTRRLNDYPKLEATLKELEDLKEWVNSLEK